jgi:hypothetical protein
MRPRRYLDRQYLKRYGSALNSREHSWSDGMKVIIEGAQQCCSLGVFLLYVLACKLQKGVKRVKSVLEA